MTFEEYLSERAISTKPKDYNNDAKLEEELVFHASKGHLDNVKELIEVNNVNPNAKNSWDTSALGTACKNDMIDVVKYLLSQGADSSLITYKDLKEIDDVEIFKLLTDVEPEEIYFAVWAHIQNGIYDVDSKMFQLQMKKLTKEQLSGLLIVASKNGQAQYVEPLIELGADIDYIGSDTKMTSLMGATMNNKLNTVALLLKLGADKNIKGFNDKTALNYAKSDEVKEMLG